MKSSGMGWDGYRGHLETQSHFQHLFSVFKMLSQCHSESTEKAITLLAQMVETNPSYFLKVTGDNGDERVRTLMSNPKHRPLTQRPLSLCNNTPE